MSLGIVRRFADLEEMSLAVAELFVELSAGGDPFCASLCGGSTPKRSYELITARPEIDWNGVHLFLGDERYVPPDDPRSNERMIRESLVDRVDIPPSQFHTIYRPEGWQESAADYDRELHRLLSRQQTFGLSLQGMGDDGHTASIFPGSAAFKAEFAGQESWAVASQGTPDAPQRVSVTLGCLAASSKIVFLVSGESKAEPLQRVFTEPDAHLRYPAAYLASQAKSVEWWVDEMSGRLIV